MLNQHEVSLTKVSYDLINNQLVRSAIDKSIDQHPLIREVAFEKYGKNKTITQASLKGILPNSLLWDQTNSYLTAKVTNAKVQDIAYTSFETGDSNGWSYSGSSLSSFPAKSGIMTFNLTSSPIRAMGLTADKTYIVSYWSKGGAYNVEGTTYKQGMTANGWTYYEHEVSGKSTVEVSGQGLIDELRLYPKGGQMTSYTYKPLVGMTSSTDAKGQTTTYEYDDFNRLKFVKDHDGKIIKQMDYHYQNQ